MKYFSNKVLDKKIKEEGGGSGDYTAGDGIEISENEISIDSETLSDIADGAEARTFFDVNGILSTSRDPFWQIGETSGLVELKSACSYVGAKKGIIFSVNQNEDANVHLEVVYKTMAGASNPIPVLHSKLPFYSDSFVSAGGLSSGGGGGGGGGATSLEGLDDVEYTGTPIAGQALVYVIRDGVGLWTNATPTGGGTVTTVANVPPTSGGDIPKAELSAALGTGTVAQSNSGLVTGGTVYSAINSALSSVLKFEGVSSTPITDGGTQTPTIGGVQVTPYKGMVVLYGAKEFVWGGNAWEELGDEASWALKTIEITGTGYLTGGGSLAANRTIDIAESVQTKIEHGESAYNRTDWDQYLGIDANGHIYVKNNKGFYSYSFVSAGGVGAGGGGGGGGATELADLEDINLVTPITGGQVLMYRDLGGGNGEWYNADIQTGGVRTVANVTPTSGGDIPLADLASAFTTGGYKLTDHEYTNGTGLSLSNGTFSLTQSVQDSLGKADTAIQTVYDLVIKNSAETTQLTYKPATSGTYSITLTKAMVGLGDVENTKLSTWAGSGNITTVGTISDGTWQGTPIGYNYVAAHYIGGTRTASAAGQATLLGIDAISNEQSSGSSDLSRIVWDSDHDAWHFLGNLYADGFVSAGGMSDSGGGGGASNLYDLLDMSSTISDKPSGTGQKIIVFNPNGTDKQNRSGAWEYANMPTGSVTSVVGEVGDITAAQIATALTSAGYKLTDTTYTAGTGLTLSSGQFSVTANTYAPYNSAGYLPLSAGNSYPLTGDLYIKKTSEPAVNFFEGSTFRGAIYSNSTGTRVYHTGTGQPQISVHGGTNYPVFRYSSTDYIVWHSGNASIANSAITLGSTSLGTSTAPIGWATAVVINGLTTEANITQDALRVYSGSGSTWTGSVTSMGYAAILAIGGPSRGFQIWASRKGSGADALFWRNGLSDMSGWAAERVIYDSGNFIAGTNYVVPATLNSYLLLAGGTLSNSTRNFFKINSTNANGPYVTFQINGSDKGYIGYYEATGLSYIWLGAGSNRLFLDPTAAGLRVGTDATNYVVYHAGNSNSLSNNADWASYRLVSNRLATRFIDAGVESVHSDHDLYIGYGARTWTNSIYFYTSTGTSGTDTITGRTQAMILNSSGLNVKGSLTVGGAVSPATRTEATVLGGASESTSWQNANLYHGIVCYRPSECIFTAASAGGYFAWYVNGSSTASMTINTSGYVGIGTGGPQYKLHVEGGDIFAYNSGGATLVLTGVARNANNGAILFTDTYASNGQRNGFKIASEYSGNAASRQNLVFYNSANSTSPYTPSWNAAMKIFDTGNITMYGATTVYTSAAIGFIVKRNDASGAANMALFPDNQETYGWLIGAQRNAASRTLSFSYRNSTDTWMAELTTAGQFNCRSLGVIRTSDGAAAFSIANKAGTNGYIFTAGGGEGYFEFHTNTGGTVGLKVTIANNGTLTTTGDQVISSDATLKTNLSPVTYTIEDIAKTRAVTFDWKDGRGHSAGSIAQDWKPLIPELVHGEEGNMTLAYGQIALVNTIILAKHETEQDKEIKRLKARVKELETRLNMS